MMNAQLLPFGLMGLMTLAIAALVVLPVIKAGRMGRSSQKDVFWLSRKVYEDRLAELHKDVASGELTQDEFASLQAELARTLLNEQKGFEEHKGHDSASSLGNPAETSASRWALFIVLLIMVLGPLYYGRMLYNPHLGAWWALEQRLEPEVDRVMSGQAPQLAQGSYSMDDFVRILQTRVEQYPDRYDVWAAIGMSYLQASVPDVASIALQRAHDLKPDDLTLALALAHARVYASNGQIDRQTQGLLKDILKKAPGQLEAELLLAEGSYNVNDYATAIPAYKALLADPNAGFSASDRAVFERHLAQSEQRATADAQNSQLAPELDVDVNLPARLRNTDPHATVYVFAKALNGPPMPLAVARYPLSALPGQVVLNDSMAMIPAMKLSVFPEVKVGAVLSLSGQAVPQEGDWVSATVVSSTLGRQQIHLSIDQQVAR